MAPARDENRRQEIKRLLDQGLTVSAIARALNCTTQNIYKLRKRLRGDREESA